MNKREIDAVTKSAGGSTLTKVARAAALNATAESLRKDLNVQLKTFADLKTRHLEQLARHWAAQGLTARTQQNRMAHVRAALRSLGRANFASDKRNSNGCLGIAKACRDGTHKPASTEIISQRIASMPEAARAAANLQNSLGLRAREAIQSNQSLRTWERQLKADRPVSVLHGTKGGRPRDTLPSTPEARKEALEAVREAIRVTDKQGGVLIASISLQGAARMYQRALNDAGFKGAEASHSLRYAWAQSQFAGHLERLGDRKEALAALSMDLGHGDGRGRYCNQVYLKGSSVEST